ncbi:flagellar protein FlhE [Pantoea sp.]|uniref:flagellar protein FlhE n=1 Tax=Pantoea sp. TaxID=69393 RepID=UPI0031D7CB09
MMRRLLLLSLVISPLALASDGSWSSQSFGGMMTRGQQVVKSQPVHPTSALPAGAIAKQLTWKISPDGPTPMGFMIKVCGGNRCLPLSGLSGEMPLPVSFPAGGPLRFEYYSSVRGNLSPPLTLLSNQVTVEYRLRK